MAARVRYRASGTQLVIVRFGTFVDESLPSIAEVSSSMEVHIWGGIEVSMYLDGCAGESDSCTLSSDSR